jgi:hypothetical protein
MGWFSKKKEVEGQEIPKLPELPEQEDLVLPSKEDLPELSTTPNNGLPEIENETNALPKLPEPEISELKTPEPDFKPKEPIKEPEIRPEGMQESKFAPLPTVPQSLKPKPIQEPSFPTQPPKIKTKPIYIRLDKFQNTEESLDEIRNKITEIESLLKRIREIKSQEEKELEDWEREIQIIKSRIESIDKNIFSRLD